eukprot:TRINITY_DN27308_c0_g1_i1.p2 TRINITY_DN27308_c0_g1~~TRINITY_DN27308_c0_g1_i1.p2  ORF type:complete len:107 (-),score=23.34 TRINITY_DN27308_c0_g1_i1:175-495(-)
MLNNTTSAPQVKWCDIDRAPSDPTLLRAPKADTSSNGQHQLPRTLGMAIRTVKTPIEDAEAASPTGSVFQLPPSHCTSSPAHPCNSLGTAKATKPSAPAVAPPSAV